MGEGNDEIAFRSLAKIAGARSRHVDRRRDSAVRKFSAVRRPVAAIAFRQQSSDDWIMTVVLRPGEAEKAHLEALQDGCVVPDGTCKEMAIAVPSLRAVAAVGRGAAAASKCI